MTGQYLVMIQIIQYSSFDVTLHTTPLAKEKDASLWQIPGNYKEIIVNMDGNSGSLRIKAISAKR